MLRCKLVERPLKSEKPDTQKDNRDLAFAMNEGVFRAENYFETNNNFDSLFYYETRKIKKYI